MEITLKGGVKLAGTPDQIKELLGKLGVTFTGDSTHYLSETKGLLEIKTMHTRHIMNAILKYYRAWVEKLSKIENPQELVAEIVSGIKDECWQGLVIECRKRTPESAKV